MKGEIRMAIWYEVEHSKKGIKDFLECNWSFHDFKIQSVKFIPETNSAEVFMKFDELKGSVILRFLNVHSMRIMFEAEFGYQEDILGSTLLLLKGEQFLWITDDTWGEQSLAHVEELKAENSWVQAERIIWAVTDNNGEPAEIPADKIDQVWSIWGRKERHHFDLTPYQENT